MFFALCEFISRQLGIREKLNKTNKYNVSMYLVKCGKTRLLQYFVFELNSKNNPVITNALHNNKSNHNQYSPW